MVETTTSFLPNSNIIDEGTALPSLANSQTPIPAPLWRRLSAITYDTFIIMALLVVVGFINLGSHIAIHGQSQLKLMTEQGYSLAGPYFFTVIVITIFSFFAFFWTKNGQTPGMQAWHIRIVNDNYIPITFKQSLLRYLIAIPSISLCFSGVLWMKIDYQQKSWQDKISKSQTIVTT